MYKLLFAFLLLMPFHFASALTAEEGLRSAAEGTGLSIEKKIPDYIGMLIRGALGLLAAIFLVLIVLAGFKWMTSAGNSQKIESAKETILNSVIGLVIVLVSYAIVEFVLRAMKGATNAGGVITQ
ncbi:hypothetical protein H6761_03785 [Candidatus Nomurabacteria bacterium]|nr:hypothetical protein [Candidatus Nomurabacteria bacterium]